MVSRRAKRGSAPLRYDGQWFRKIFDEGPLGIVVTGTNRAIVQANAAFCAMLGYTQDELAGRQVEVITHPEDVNDDVDLVGRLLRGQIPRFKIEKRYLRKDGTAITAMVNVSLLHSTSGQAKHLLAMVEDISERKHAEQSLRESQQRLSLAVETIRAALSQYDFRTGALEWNDRCYEILGYAPGYVVPSLDLWRSRVHPEDRARAEEDVYRGAKQRKDILSEYRVIWPDGTVRWVRAARRIGYDASGQPITCTSIAYDITESKQAEAALLEHRDRLKLAIAVAQAGTSLWDLQTGEMQWNDRTFEILGHAPDAFVPTYERWRSQVHPDDIAEVEAQFRQCIEERRDYANEHRIIRPNGETRWVRLMARVTYGPDGQPIHSTAVATDITEAKEAEIRLRGLPTPQAPAATAPCVAPAQSER